MKKLIEKIKKSWLIKRTTTIVFVLALITLFIALTLIVNKLELNPIDFTKDKLYTLTDTSKEQLSSVTKDVNIYFVEYSENSSVMDLSKQYHNINDKINIEVVDSTSRPDLANKYGIETGSSGVIVESGEKSKILSDYDFYTYDPTTYEEIDITEEKITNAILYVTADKVPTVYFMEGYSEFSIEKNMNYLATYLGNEVVQYDTLNVLTTGKIPDDCDTLVITTPSKDFDEIAYNAIVEYINKGGNILWLNAAITENENFQNVNKVLALYGVNPFEVGNINESDENRMMTDSPFIILPEIEQGTITKNISAILLPDATKINVVEDTQLEELEVEKVDILTASEKSYFSTDFQFTKSEEGPFIVGTELIKTVIKADEEQGVSEIKSTLVIYGENIFVSDYTLSQTSNTPVIAYAHNKDLCMDTIAYLVDRQQDIVIRKDVNTVTYTATEAQNKIIQGIIFGVPVLLIFIGILVWQHRRRKK